MNVAKQRWQSDEQVDESSKGTSSNVNFPDDSVPSSGEGESDSDEEYKG